ncbi:MAG: TonB-dependent receptor [Acidobacteria bacterium]|nr:TonB-dependent receptor [Acidobacteriota bacterium]
MTRSLLTLILTSVIATAQDTAGVGTLTGAVKDSLGNPVNGANVCLASQGRCALSSETGSFRITDVRPGAYQLEVTAPGRAGFTSTSIDVRAGLEAVIEIALPQIDSLSQSITVSEPVFLAPEEIKNSGFLIQRFEVFKAAGVQQDVSRYVQTLPGVGTGTNDFRNDLIVRGGSPLENLFLVDNVEIPNINNFANFASAGGTTSLIDPALIQDVTFLTGGYPAPYINRTSGVLQITQREGSREGFESRVSLGSPGLGGIVEGPLGKERKGSWVFSAKRSFLDAVTNDIGIGGVPVNYNFNAKALYDLTPKDRIWVVNITGIDRIRLGATDKPKTDPDRNPELDLIDVRYRGWRAATGLNWQRLFGSRGVGLLGVTNSEGKVTQSVKDLFKFGFSAPTATQLIAQTPALFEENSRERELTLKYDLVLYAGFLEKLQAGGSVKNISANYDTAQPFGQDNPFSSIRDLNPFSLRRSATARQSSAYLQSSRNLGNRWNVTWGGRFDHYAVLGRSRLSPRAGISYRLTDRLVWRSSYGLYFQQPLLLFIESFPQNKGLIPIRASHVVTGFSYNINAATRASVEAYQKIYSGYPASSQFPSFSLANAGDTFAVSDILLPYVSAGRGRVRGLEMAIERKFTDRWYGQANVSISRTRHAGLDGIMRSGTYDYPVITNLLGGYQFRKKWDFSGRVTYLSGKPYTPFNEALSRAQRRGIFDLDRVNGVRAPDYFRLDLRVDRTFTVRGKPFLVFFGAQNVTNRTNVARASWDRQRNAPRFNRQLGLFPLIGLEWRL